MPMRLTLNGPEEALPPAAPPVSSASVAGFGSPLAKEAQVVIAEKIVMQQAKVEAAKRRREATFAAARKAAAAAAEPNEAPPPPDESAAAAAAAAAAASSSSAAASNTVAAAPGPAPVSTETDPYPIEHFSDSSSQALPQGWKDAQTKRGDACYENMVTGQKFFDLPHQLPAAEPLPLPDGWSTATSTTTGVTYFQKPVGRAHSHCCLHRECVPASLGSLRCCMRRTAAAPTTCPFQKLHREVLLLPIQRVQPRKGQQLHCDQKALGRPQIRAAS